MFSFSLLKNLSAKNEVHCITLSDLRTQQGLVPAKAYTVIEFGGKLRHITRYLLYRSFSIIAPGRLDPKLLNDDWDCIVVDHLRSYGMIYPFLAKLKYQKLYYLAHNIEHLNRKQKIHFRLTWRERFVEKINFGIDKVERQLINLADAVYTLTPFDSYVIRNEFFKRKTTVVRPRFPSTSGGTQSGGTAVLLIGSLLWFPNRLGVESFLDALSDKLLENRPVIVVGNCPPGFAEKWSRPNVQILGFVDDLESIYSACEYLVVPNVFGTGIKMKIYDGLKRGLKVLAVKESAVGYDEKTKNLFVFDDVHDICNFLHK